MHQLKTGFTKFPKSQSFPQTNINRDGQKRKNLKIRGFNMMYSSCIITKNSDFTNIVELFGTFNVENQEKLWEKTKNPVLKQIFHKKTEITQIKPHLYDLVMELMHERLLEIRKFLKRKRKEFRDPITKKMMKRPVFAQNGFVYDIQSYQKKYPSKRSKADFYKPWPIFSSQVEKTQTDVFMCIKDEIFPFYDPFYVFVKTCFRQKRPKQEISPIVNLAGEVLHSIEIKFDLYFVRSVEYKLRFLILKEKYWEMFKNLNTRPIVNIKKSIMFIFIEMGRKRDAVKKIENILRYDSKKNNILSDVEQYQIFTKYFSLIIKGGKENLMNFEKDFKPYFQKYTNLVVPNKSKQDLQIELLEQSRKLIKSVMPNDTGIFFFIAEHSPNKGERADMFFRIFQQQQQGIFPKKRQIELLKLVLSNNEHHAESKVLLEELEIPKTNEDFHNRLKSFQGEADEKKKDEFVMKVYNRVGNKIFVIKEVVDIYIKRGEYEKIIGIDDKENEEKGNEGDGDDERKKEKRHLILKALVETIKQYNLPLKNKL